MSNAYFVLQDGSLYELDVLNPGAIASWRRRLALARAPESDKWLVAGGGVDDVTEIELAVHVKTGSTIGDGAKIAEILAAARQAVRVGIRHPDGSPAIGRDINGLLRTSTQPLGRGTKLSVTLAGVYAPYESSYRITSDGDRRVTSDGDPRIVAEAI